MRAAVSWAPKFYQGDGCFKYATWSTNGRTVLFSETKQAILSQYI